MPIYNTLTTPLTAGKIIRLGRHLLESLKTKQERPYPDLKHISAAFLFSHHAMSFSHLPS